MAQQAIVIVNASPVLSDDQVRNVIPAMQKQIDRDFMPAWRGHAVHGSLSFLPWAEYADKPEDAWPIFVNRHAKDQSMLGYHTDEDGLIYSRVFAGDVSKIGLDWTVTLSHELLEILADPPADKVFRMHDGRYAALEVCDPVESDDQAYIIDGVAVSNFVLPSYFSRSIRGGKFDHRGVLSGPCPMLSPGGYISIMDERGAWSDTYANQRDGLMSRRAILNGFRRQYRSRKTAVSEFMP